MLADLSEGPTPALPEGGEGEEKFLAIVNVLRHLASSYQQFMSGTGAGNVARLFVRLLHSDGHIPSQNVATGPVP